MKRVSEYKMLDLFADQEIEPKNEELKSEEDIEDEESEGEDNEVFDPNSALKGLRFALIGRFTKRKSELKKQIIQAGGNKRIGLSKNVRAIVYGKNPSKKDLAKIEMLNHDGYYFPSLSEQELMDILSGVNKDLSYPEVAKNVNITYDFIFNPKFKSLVTISRDGITHRLGGREIFTHKIPGNKYLFWQIIGDLAGSASETFDPSTADYIMLPKSTIESLKNGVKDELILLVSKVYNESKAKKFTYKFVLEDDLIPFAKSRSMKINDTITLNLIEKYESESN